MEEQKQKHKLGNMKKNTPTKYVVNIMKHRKNIHVWTSSSCVLLIFSVDSGVGE